jgi:hypothetical protein
MDEDTNPIGDIDAETMNEASRSGSPQTAEVKWSSKIGDQLNRDEQCLFKTVGYVSHLPLSLNCSTLAKFLSIAYLMPSIPPFTES